MKENVQKVDCVDNTVKPSNRLYFLNNNDTNRATVIGNESVVTHNN